MKCIPVLDLLGGQVVRGVAGNRESYRPIQSQLCPGSDPLEVANTLSLHFGFQSFYLADLDGILHDQPNDHHYERILKQGYELWIDCGLQTETRARELLKLEHHTQGRIQLIAGLETCPNLDFLKTLLEMIGPSQLFFSLDLQSGIPMAESPFWKGKSPIEIGELAHTLGIRQLIVLDLKQVGTGQGVSTLPLCRGLKERFPDLSLVTGGGVRGPEDLCRLQQEPLDGILVASALHDGRLQPADLFPYD